MTLSNYIGILGLGNRSTLFYIDSLNKAFSSKFGCDSTFPFKLLNADFSKINPFLPDQFDHLDSILANYIDQVIALGIFHILIPNITLHETLDRIKVKYNLKVRFIHPLQLCLPRVIQGRYEEILVIGSKYTMQAPYISKSLESSGVKLSHLSDSEMEKVDKLRMNIYSETETDIEVERFIELISRQSYNCAVIIACTELSIVMKELAPNIIDLARLQISEAVDLMKVNSNS